VHLVGHTLPDEHEKVKSFRSGFIGADVSI
jgi:hypothetical protein